MLVEDIIHKNQVGFMKGWYIGENLLSLNSIIRYINEKNADAVLISFDFEKAFDMVEWRAVQGGLTYFDFGYYIKDILLVIYEDSSVYVCVCAE